MSFNYHNRKFVSTSNSPNGEVNGQTVFEYFQEENILWAIYSGGGIVKGTMTGIVRSNGEIEFAYQHVNDKLEIMTGKCKSYPTILSDGRIQLHEAWQWTSGDLSTGESIVEELL